MLELILKRHRSHIDYTTMLLFQYRYDCRCEKLLITEGAPGTASSTSPEEGSPRAGVCFGTAAAVLAPVNSG